MWIKLGRWFVSGRIWEALEWKVSWALEPDGTAVCGSLAV